FCVSLFMFARVVKFHMVILDKRCCHAVKLSLRQKYVSHRSFTQDDTRVSACFDETAQDRTVRLGGGPDMRVLKLVFSPRRGRRFTLTFQGHIPGRMETNLAPDLSRLDRFFEGWPGNARISTD
ncbi:MAG: hypothetical protein ABIH41_04430, partial [Nanoarchaeota archaeon]